MKRMLASIPPLNDQQLYNQYAEVLRAGRVSAASVIQIEKDIKRTFSAQNYFNNSENAKGYNRLKRILGAISAYRDVGYVQGMNYIAASLLWHCDEDIAYYILVQLFDKLGAAQVYAGDLSGIQRHTDTFYSGYLPAHAPEIHANLQAKEVIPQMILPEWFVTLGTSIVPLQHHAQMFINLLQFGWAYLYKVLLKYLRLLYPFFVDEEFGSTVLLIKNLKGEDGRVVEVNWAGVLEN